MNRVDINASGAPLPAWKNRAKAYILKVLETLGKTNWELSALFCDNALIRRLNARYRGRDEATDVLSFALAEKRRGRFLAGDIIISLPALAENARAFAVSPDEELRRLLVHGILHLDGREHETNEDSEPMLRLQEKIVADIAGKIMDETDTAGGAE